MDAHSNPPSPADWLAYQQWLDGVVSLQEGAGLRGGLHVDTLKKLARKEGQLLRRSEGRFGVRRRWALMKD
jgi:hypothetical protein